MSGPPNIRSSELVARLASRPQPSRVVDFPGTTAGEKVRLLVPPERDHTEARLEGEDRVRAEMRRRLGRNPELSEMQTATVQEVVGDAVAKEILSRCVVSVDPIGSEGSGKVHYARMFPDAKWMEGNLTADEIAILFTEWQLVQSELGPRASVLTETDLDAWVAKLKEGLWELGPLASLTWLDLAELARFACRRISELQSSFGHPIPESQSLESLSTSEQPSTELLMGSSLSGEQPENSSPGIAEPFDSKTAAELARKLHR